MQIDRLIETIFILTRDKKTTAKQLANKFEVSVRTIYRDIDTLTLANIPIYYVKGRNGGIYIDKDYTFNNENIDSQEYYLLAIKLLKSIGLTNINYSENISDKENWITFEKNELDEQCNYQKKLDKLKKAINHNRKIQFIYYSKIGQTSLRTINPIEVIFNKNNDWIMLGYCNDNCCVKEFMIKSMIELKLMPDTFLTKNHLFNRENNIIDVHLRFNKRITYKMYDDFKYHTICRNNDGSYDIVFSLNDDDNLVNFILSFGSNVQIIKPEWLKDKIKIKCLNFLENNF